MVSICKQDISFPREMLQQNGITTTNSIQHEKIHVGTPKLFIWRL